MVQSRICLSGSFPQSVVTLSNAGNSGDDIIILEGHRYAAGEMDASYCGHHVLTILSGQPIQLESRSEGRIERKTLVPGDMCFSPEGVVFRLRKDEPSEVLHVGLTPAFVDDVALQTFGAPPSLRPFHGVSDPQIMHLIFALQAGLQQSAGAHRIYVESVGTALCVHLLRNYGADNSADGERSFDRARVGRQRLARTLDYIQAHLDADLSLADIANIACMSPYHFSRAFKTSTGLTPHQYVLRARVEAARNLLVGGKLSLSEIAYEVGFCDQGHLTRHFKRRYGVPPSTFVEQSC